jgi:alpha-L-rhamnosidase/Glycosyl hydrolases family 2, sugar binding domain
MNWGEHPGNLKAVGDRNFALGINKMVLHVFTHNPWIDKKPGMTLDGVGLYFQRDQTWFKQSKSWIDYLTRCQALLQMGKPVVDIAVFTGEEIPRRSVLPDRLANTLPGIFGKEKVDAETIRLANAGQPMRQIPDGVSHSANMADPEDWIDPLNGYAYDCFNPDVLMTMKVVNGRVVTPSGANYGVLVFPGKHPMQPNNTLISFNAAKTILQLVKDGAKIIMSKSYLEWIGLKDKESDEWALDELIYGVHRKGKVIFTPYLDSSFVKLGVQRDLEILNNNHSIAWTHRKAANTDIYFLSNQTNTAQSVRMSLRVNNMLPEVWNPVNGNISETLGLEVEKGRTTASVQLEANQSVFIVFRKKAVKYKPGGWGVGGVPAKHFSKKWEVLFNKNYDGTEKLIVFDDLISWSQNSDSQIKYYSGSAIYQNSFVIDKNEFDSRRVVIEFDSIYNIATIRVNGIDCGTLWTRPYELDITKGIKAGENKIEIEVTNTWHNRLIGDNLLPTEKRTTWTTAPFRLKDKLLLPAGIAGNVILKLYYLK